MPPLSIYLHIPWCVRKCPYCDFNSHRKGDELDEQQYIDALCHDMDAELSGVDGRSISSLFIGGGTPSLFSPASIASILENIDQRFTLDDDIEITMEANPGTFEQERFDGFRQAGINRLSIGIQSFDADHLRTLGRIHDDAEARRAVEIARTAGFDNINLDLMFALPEQTTEQALGDVDAAIAAGVEHISHYQLTIEPNTYFHKHPPVQPDIDEMWAMQNACQEKMAEAGFSQYEVSAYAREDRRSRHNLNYWRFGDYLGFGAGAHGKITDGSGTISRRWKRRQPQDYIDHARVGEATSGTETIATEDIVFEFLLNALRLRDGVALDDFEEHTGLDRRDLIAACEPVDDGLLIIDEERVVTSERGYRFLNEVLERLLPS